MANKSLIGGLIVLIFAVIGTVAFYPYYTGTDYCYAGGSYGLWEETGEHIYFNDTFPSMGRYYCGLEATIPKEFCSTLDPKQNIDGCKWGGKLSTSKKMLYVMEDPEIPVTTTISEVKPMIATAIDTGLDKTKGIKLDLVENGLTHKVLEIVIENNITANDLSILLTENNALMQKGKLSKKEVITETFDIYKDSCTTKAEVNGSTTNTCIKVFDKTGNREIIKWNNIPLKSENTDKLDRMSTFSILAKGVYHYEFDMPIVKREGWGNAGTAYIKLGDTLYVDKQGSTWFNNSFKKEVIFRLQNNETFNKPNFPEKHCLPFPNNNVANCTKEIRLLQCSNEADSSCAIGNWNEITSYVYNETYSGGYCIGACFTFKSNVSVSTTRDYAALINYSEAPETTYTDQIYALDNFYNTSFDDAIWKEFRAGAGESYIINNGRLNITTNGYSPFGITPTRTFSPSLMGEAFGYIPTAPTGGNTIMMSYNDGSDDPAYWFNKDAGTLWSLTDGGAEALFQRPNIDSQDTWFNFGLEVNSTSFGAWFNSGSGWGLYGTIPRLNTDTNFAFANSAPISVIFDNVIVYEGAKGNVVYTFFNTSTIKSYVGEFSDNAPPTIGAINCTNGTTYKSSSFVWNEQVNSCQVICTDDVAITYAKFDGTEGVSAFDTTDTNDTWFSNITNYTNSGNYFSMTIPPSFNLMNYSSAWNVTALCHDGTSSVTSSIQWTIPNGNVNVTLLNPNTNITKQNGTYILNVQARKGCVGGECFNTSQYFTIGV